MKTFERIIVPTIILASIAGIVIIATGRDCAPTTEIRYVETPATIATTTTAPPATTTTVAPAKTVAKAKVKATTTTSTSTTSTTFRPMTPADEDNFEHIPDYDGQPGFAWCDVTSGECDLDFDYVTIEDEGGENPGT